MSDIILRVENVSKQYRLGTFGTNTIGGDVHRWWTTKIRGKEDPFLKVGDVNDRTSKVKSDFIWALKDINFEVKRGEVLGIIGKNGAGKSTLLKLLSRITTPTTGSIESWGRMASLLEVGTGFHPELTGRENIFLNGAILGMTKSEIRRKLDEIIDFSGCALYIDTPVKRYSSGMTVRLGFAVAAFLDPEILIVDEVLAVGDAEFQKKAIGKMKDISRGEGRTVLFVSHNLDSIKKLCNSSIILKNGKLHLPPQDTNIILKEYLKTEQNLVTLFPVITKRIIFGGVEILYLLDEQQIRISIDLEVIAPSEFIRLNIGLYNELEALVSTMTTQESIVFDKIGKRTIVLKLDASSLKTGRYGLRMYAGIPGVEYILMPSYIGFFDHINPSSKRYLEGFINVNFDIE